MIRYAPDLSIVGASACPASMSQSSGQAVTKYPENRTKLRGKSDKEIGQRIGSFLRSLYQRKTAEMVAADLDISPTTVLPWIEGRSVPGGIAIGRLLDAYGPEFAAAVYGLDWLKRAARAKQLEDAQQELAAAEARIARLSA